MIDTRRRWSHFWRLKHFQRSVNFNRSMQLKLQTLLPHFVGIFEMLN